MTQFAEDVAASLERLRKARSIADDLRHDPKLHQLAMTVVFILEDLLETLVRALGEQARGRRTPGAGDGGRW